MSTRLILAAVATAAFPATVVSAYSRRSAPQVALDTNSRSDMFADINPQTYLDYHDCSGAPGFQCARLLLPLDWTQPRRNPLDQVALAIAHLPARVPVTDPRYGGVILYNPGGPGNSGVDNLIDNGAAIQEAVDAAYAFNSSDYVSPDRRAKYFDLIGFDPRGVFYSTPFHTCVTDPSAAIFSLLALYGNPLIDTSDVSYDLLYAQMDALNRGCIYDAVSNPNGSRIANHMSTSDAARDMLEIAERHGEWREKQAGGNASAETIAWKRGKEPINLWGVSYGTNLGQLAGAMYPERVNRFFLDGVDDAEEHFSGVGLHKLVDTDAVVELEFEYCAKAGQAACPLWNGPTGADTRRRVEAILSDIRQNGPIVVTKTASNEGFVIALSDVLGALFGMAYNPIHDLPIYASILGPLSQRDGIVATPFFTDTILTSITSDPIDTPVDPYDLRTRGLDSIDVQPFIAVQCGEAALVRNKTEYHRYAAFLERQSRWGGRPVATGTMPCSSWPGRAAFNFAASHPVASNHTKHPILFASSTLDPICPLRGARLGVQHFPGSGLIVVDGGGHTSSTNPSWRMVKAIRHYFQTGEILTECTVRKPCLPLIRPYNLTDRTEPLPRNPTREEQNYSDVALALLPSF